MSQRTLQAKEKRPFQGACSFPWFILPALLLAGWGLPLWSSPLVIDTTQSQQYGEKVSMTQLDQGKAFSCSQLRAGAALSLQDVAESTGIPGPGPVDAGHGSGYPISRPGQSSPSDTTGSSLLTFLFIDETVARLPVTADFSTDGQFCDIEGDGDFDLLVANSNGRRNRLFVNNGQGIFFDETERRLPQDHDFSLAIACGDVDGDGDPDLFVANNFAFQWPDCQVISGQNRLLINTGQGVFVDETELRLPGSIATSPDAKFVDVDSDGDLDIVVVNSIRPGDCAFLGGGQIQLLMNNGAGYFADETNGRMPQGLYSDTGLDAGDIDSDGDFDLVVANPFARNRILNNDGRGIFTDQSDERLPDLLCSTADVCLFDVERDGDVDIFWSNDSSSVWPGQDGAQDRLLLNDGSGLFHDDTFERLPAVSDLSMGGAEAGDLDNDGDIDIMVANNKQMSEGRENHLLLNEGMGFFGGEASSVLPGVSDISADIALGDINGDGLLDAFVANYGGQSRMLLGRMVPKSPPDPEVLIGDIDGDGTVTVLDAMAVVNHILGQQILSDADLVSADCNGDGQVDVLDALGIVNGILGIGGCSR